MATGPGYGQHRRALDDSPTVPGSRPWRPPQEGGTQPIPVRPTRAGPAVTTGPGSPVVVDPVLVDVANTTNRTGLAAGVADLLDNHGYAPGRIDNAPPTGRSVVQAAPPARTAAERVARLLGGLLVRTDPALPHDRVRVTLGRDYDGPTPATAQRPDIADERTPGDDAHGAPDSPTFTADGIPCVN